MFKLFKQNTINEFTMDEREALIKDYLYKAESLAGSFQYNRKPYYRGGVEDLDKFIADLLIVQERIKSLETIEMFEKRTQFEELIKEK